MDALAHRPERLNPFDVPPAATSSAPVCPWSPPAPSATTWNTAATASTSAWDLVEQNLGDAPARTRLADRPGHGPVHDRHHPAPRPLRRVPHRAATRTAASPSPSAPPSSATAPAPSTSRSPLKPSTWLPDRIHLMAIRHRRDLDHDTGAYGSTGIVVAALATQRACAGADRRQPRPKPPATPKARPAPSPSTSKASWSPSNPQTGVVRILRSVHAADAGRVLERPPMPRPDRRAASPRPSAPPSTNIIDIDNEGNVTTPSFRTYHIPTLADLPRTEIHFADTYDRLGPNGAKSMSESPFNPVAAALANAIADATGIRLHATPFAPDRIFRPAHPMKALRGAAISFRANPFHHARALIHHEDALGDHRARPHHRLRPPCRPRPPPQRRHAGTPPQRRDLRRLHRHPRPLPATGNDRRRRVRSCSAGSNRYTFPVEQRFAEPGPRRPGRQCLPARAAAGPAPPPPASTAPCTRNPSTRSSPKVHPPQHPHGRRQGPDGPQRARHALLDTPQRGYDDSKALIERWHKAEAASTTPSPPASPSPAPRPSWHAAATLLREHNGLLLQTHLAESPAEIDLGERAVSPTCTSYLDVYAKRRPVPPRIRLRPRRSTSPNPISAPATRPAHPSPTAPAPTCSSAAACSACTMPSIPGAPCGSGSAAISAPVPACRRCAVSATPTRWPPCRAKA